MLFVVPGHATRLRVDQMQSPASGTLHRPKHVGIRDLVGDERLHVKPCVRAAKKNGPHEKLTPRASSGFFLRPNNVHTGSDCDDCHYDEYDDLERFGVHLSLHYEWNGFLLLHNQRTRAAPVQFRIFT